MQSVSWPADEDQYHLEVLRSLLYETKTLTRLSLSEMPSTPSIVAVLNCEHSLEHLRVLGGTTLQRTFEESSQARGPRSVYVLLPIDRRMIAPVLVHAIIAALRQNTGIEDFVREGPYHENTCSCLEALDLALAFRPEVNRRTRILGQTASSMDQLALIAAPDSGSGTHLSSQYLLSVVFGLLQDIEGGPGEFISGVRK